MTMISQYLQAEELDQSDPASFHVPGLADWRDLRTARGQAGMLSRSAVEKELLYPVIPEDVIEQ